MSENSMRLSTVADLTVLELSELVKASKISLATAAAPMMMGAMPAAALRKRLKSRPN